MLTLMRFISAFVALASVILCSIVLSSCGTNTKTSNIHLKTTRDLLPDNVFTAGIEGPAVDKDGVLYAVNYQRQATIGAINPGKNGQPTASVYAQLPDGSVGNGIRFDSHGTMYVADYTGHKILKKKSHITPFEVHASNPMMYQPNDLAIMDNGIIFASDPDWKNGRGQLWKIMQNGDTVLLEKNMGTTNGIEVSPDNLRLYVNESKQRKIWVYDLSAEGNISNKRMFYQFEDFGLDGMRCDIHGNLYVSRYDGGKVVVLSPEGEILYGVKLKGQKPTNVAFGGPRGKTVYVTMQDRGTVEYFSADFPGRAYTLHRMQDESVDP